MRHSPSVLSEYMQPYILRALALQTHTPLHLFRNDRTRWCSHGEAQEFHATRITVSLTTIYLRGSR
jgi:hypothetical protein